MQIFGMTDIGRERLVNQDDFIAKDLLPGLALLCVCDGTHALPLPSAQDHKRVFDEDKGPNTGGMGAYSPAPVLPDNCLESLTDICVRPVLQALARDGHPFVGVLYAGLMMTADGPKVLEYNVRSNLKAGEKFTFWNTMCALAILNANPCSCVSRAIWRA